jgi:AcrR family transcriptional regulator
LEASVKKRPDLLAGEDLLPAPRQKRSIEKHARIKAAGLAIFCEKGYERATVEEIAARAKLAVGGFYQHFRSKRQLLIALMDDLLDALSRIEFRPQASADMRGAIRTLLAGAFEHDLRYLGAYRAWQEAILSDPALARKQQHIHAWTTARVMAVFDLLRKVHGARTTVDVAALARVMDGFFWGLLARAAKMRKAELNQWIDAATHLIYHALFTDRRV